MENKKQMEQEMTGTERFVGVWRALLFFLVLFVISSMAHYENNAKERLAHHEVSKRRLQQQILLGKNQMLLVEISKMVRFLPQAINNRSCKEHNAAVKKCARAIDPNFKECDL